MQTKPLSLEEAARALADALTRELVAAIKDERKIPSVSIAPSVQPAAERPARRLISVREVSETVGLGKSTIYQHVAAGKFPRPLSLGTTTRWVSSEIDAWIAARIAERDVGG